MDDESRNTSTITARRIRVTGKVQQVSFRAYAKRQARRLGVAGSATNRPDGSVELVVEGSSRDVKSFVNWCRRGSPIARVESMQVDEIAVTGLSDFRTG